MKRHFITFLLTASFLAGAAQAQPAAPEAKAQSTNDQSNVFDKQKTSYAIGLNYGSGLKTQMSHSAMTVDEFDVEALAHGFKDGLGSGPTLITDEEKTNILNDFSKIVKARVAAKQQQMADEQKAKAEKNLVDGPAFLAKNKVQPGVITTASGLQYKVLTEGTGPAPGPNDEVSVNYAGRVIDGTEFDNSAKSGRPFTTKVSGGVIPGWTEVLQLMKTGSKYEVYIPANLAYGPTARGPVIAPNSVLIFDMELVSVKPAQAAPPAAPPTSSAAPVSTTVLTSDIIKVPSKAELDKGAKIETIKAEDLEKEKAKAAQQ
jgi:FKBP-type peptidyl-prolyl cis-trans isomerase FklB